MIRRLTVTDNDAAVTFLRLVLGVLFFAHGAQKALGWFGGYGSSIRLFYELGGDAEGRGFEFHLLVLAITAFLMLRGAGAASVNRLLSSPAKKSIPAKVRPQAA
jgi:uncharacterized membrane protein YphA (DoxX/SURF4 family)